MPLFIYPVDDSDNIDHFTLHEQSRSMVTCGYFGADLKQIIMLTQYQINQSKKHSSPRQSLTPKQQNYSFSLQQQMNRHISQSRHRIKQLSHVTHKNETEITTKSVRLPKKEGEVQVVVREGQKRTQDYHFTFTEGQIPTEEEKIGANSNIRLVIQGGRCRKDTLKLNKRKLEAMIAKIHQGKTDLNGPVCTIDDVVLQKCQPRTRAFFMIQPRKTEVWKAQRDDSVSPKQFDTREYLICHSVRQEKREPSRLDNNSWKGKTASPLKNDDRMAWSSYSNFSHKKYRRKQPKGTCRTQQRLKETSLQRLHHSSSFKHMQTTNSFNPNTLKGWQPSQQRQIFLWQGFALDH